MKYSVEALNYIENNWIEVDDSELEAFVREKLAGHFTIG